MTDDGVNYPHIRGAGVILPDCSRGVYTPFRLTSREKRELVRKLAEKGLSGIDEFLENGSVKGSVTDRLEELRKKMEEELQRVRTLRREALDDQIRQIGSRAGLSRRESDDGILEDGSAFRRFSAEEIRGEILASELIGALEGRVKIEPVVEKVGFLKRVWLWVRSIFRRIISTLLGFFRWVGGRFGRKKKAVEEPNSRSKGSISLPFPSLERDLEGWERELRKNLDKDDNLQKAVNKGISEQYGYSSDLIMLKQSYDPEWYREEAMRILRKEVEESVDRKEGEIKDRKKEMERNRNKREEEKRRAKERVMELEREFETEMKEKEISIDDLSREKVKDELVSRMSQMGYIDRRVFKDEMDRVGTEWEITEALVEKFSELIYAEVMEGRRGTRDQRGSSVSDAGVYDKARLRMIGEEARMDILQTMVNSRVNHPSDRSILDSDVMVLREVTTTEVHAVMILDISGSMDENNRLEAAKRSVLALTQAVKRDNLKNRVDIISMSTSATPISLKEVMGLEPRGFTNHQEALALACSIFDSTRADRFLLFLITDGLPEAYTGEGGEAVAGDLEKAMEKAIGQASRLHRYRDLHFNLFLLEPEDEDYVNSARKLAREGGGKVIVADPTELASRVLGTIDEGSGLLGGV